MYLILSLYTKFQTLFIEDFQINQLISASHHDQAKNKELKHASTGEVDLAFWAGKIILGSLKKISSDTLLEFTILAVWASEKLSILLICIKQRKGKY